MNLNRAGKIRWSEGHCTVKVVDNRSVPEWGFHDENMEYRLTCTCKQTGAEAIATALCMLSLTDYRKAEERVAAKTIFRK